MRPASPTTPARSGRGRWCATGSRSSAWRRRSTRSTRAWPARRRNCAPRGGGVVTLLVISPDYASHLLPLATLATAWRDRGRSGRRRDRPRDRRHRRGLRLRASSPAARARLESRRHPGRRAAPRRGRLAAGLLRRDARGDDPDARYQAKERLTDLMWDPVAAGRATLRIVASCGPTRSSSTTSPSARGWPWTPRATTTPTSCSGTPRALPVGDELYGFPPAWPSAFRPTAAELSALRELCERVSQNFTSEWNRATAQLDAAATPTASAFATHGPLVFYNYPAQLRPEAPSTGPSSSARPDASSPRTPRSRPGSRTPCPSST